MYKGNYISIENCKNGYLYKIFARNSWLGIWWAKKKGFIILREKMGSTYLFTEYHWDTGEPFGTVKPIELVECYGNISHNFRDYIVCDSTEKQRKEYKKMYDYLLDKLTIIKDDRIWE